jgi:hypothetical protein
MLVSLKTDASRAMTIPAKLQSLPAGVLFWPRSTGKEHAWRGVGSQLRFASRRREGTRRQCPPHEDAFRTERKERGQAARDYYVREFDHKLCLDKAERILTELAQQQR